MIQLCLLQSNYGALFNCEGTHHETLSPLHPLESMMTFPWIQGERIEYTSEIDQLIIV